MKMLDEEKNDSLWSPTQGDIKPDALSIPLPKPPNEPEPTEQTSQTPLADDDVVEVEISPAASPTEQAAESEPTEQESAAARSAPAAAPAPAAANAPSGVAEKAAEPAPPPAPDETAEQEEYWDSVLTGNLSNVPQEVRRKLESAHPQGVIDHETLATGIMQSWVADTGAFSPESVRRDWRQIRKRVAQQYGATGCSDTELFIAVSNDRQVRQIRRQTLLNLYRETYERTLSSEAADPNSTTKAALAREDKSLQKVAEVIEKRAQSDAMDDYRRLNDSATVILRGLEGLVAAERALNGKSALNRGGALDPAQMIGAQLISSYDVTAAAKKLGELTPEDRVKVYRMLSPFIRKTPELKEAVTASLGRGVTDVGINLTQLGINGLAWLLPTGADKTKLDELSRNLQELRNFAHFKYTPLYEEKEQAWVRNLLVDMGQMGANTALAFCGPYGLAAVMGGETGNAMATARALNPEGDFNAQMMGAAASGAVNAALSLGMSKLGQRLLSQSLQGFRAVRPGRFNAGALKESAGRIAVDAALMTTENKLTELTPMLAQEVVGAATDKAAGVDWGEWRDRQLSVSEQLREAAMMMPFLLIGAGRSSLGHFRRPELLLAEGEALSLFGIAEETRHRLVSLAKTDVNAAGELLQRELRQSPLWSNPFFATMAVEWSRILNEQSEPFFRSEKEAVDFLKLPAPIRARRWNDRSWEMVQKIRDIMSGKPEFEKIRTEWLTRAGLLNLMVDEIDRPDKRYRLPIYDADDIFDTWYDQLIRNEREDLAILNKRMGAGISARLIGRGPFDFKIEEARQSFLEERLKRSIYRPYKMLLLTYPERMGAKADKIDWAARATDLEIRNKANLHEGVMELVYGATQEEVNMHVARRFWESVCRERYGGERGRRWLEEGAEVLGIKRMRRDRKQKATLLSSLAEMSIRMSQLSARQRSRVSPELKEMNRLVWETMADVKSLFMILPNLSDFDAAAGRALRPEQCFSYLLTRMLECDPVTTSMYAGNLSSAQLRVKMKPLNKTKSYPGTAQVKANLSTLYPIIYKSMMIDGERLWSMRYPEGSWTNLHNSKRAAEAEMMARVSRLFSPACRTKHDVLQEWLWLSNKKDAKLNFIYYNLRNLPESSKMTVFDKLTHLATCELLLDSYNEYGALASGEKLTLKEKVWVPKELINPVRSMNLDILTVLDEESGVRTLPDVKGLVQSELALISPKSPMDIIDQKAMSVWNRLIRTGQLGVDEAWAMLCRLGKAPKGAKFTNETDLMMRLCRLSKEYLFTKLDHEDVPKAVMLWLRYGVVMPAYADKQLPQISKSARALQGKIKNKQLPYEFESMLQETIGINNFIKMERLWSRPLLPVKLSAMERYAHGVVSGRLLSLTPEHVRRALVERLAALEEKPAEAETVPVDKPSDAETVDAEVVAEKPAEAEPALPEVAPAEAEPADQIAQRRMDELSRLLKKYPELNSWRIKANGKYRHWEKFDRAWYEPSHDWRDPVAEPRIVTPSSLTQKVGYVEPRKISRFLRIKKGTQEAVRSLEAIREVFATLPEATEHGIVWQGDLYRIDSNVLPRGVTKDWKKRIPLVNTIPLIREIYKRKHLLKIVKPPLTPKKEVAQVYFSSSCVIYRNPKEPGHSVRLMPGIPESAVPEARAPYVVHCWSGVYLNKDGMPALSERDTYIPLELFTGAATEPEEWQAGNTCARNRRRVLKNLSDPAAQMRAWWSPTEADSCLLEDVIRLYEELGIRRALGRREMGLLDPVVVQTLNLVSRLLIDPMLCRTSMERYGEKHKDLLREGQRLKYLIDSHEQP